MTRAALRRLVMWLLLLSMSGCLALLLNLEIRESDTAGISLVSLMMLCCLSISLLVLTGPDQ